MSDSSDIWNDYDDDDFINDSPYTTQEEVEKQYKIKNKKQPKYPKRDPSMLIHDSSNYVINDLKDLIYLCQYYAGIKYDVFQLFRLLTPLNDLNNLVGMDKLKNSVVDLVTYHISGLNEDTDEDFLHTILVGPPGTGKTTAAGILARIYLELGCIESSKVIFAKRQDFIAEFVGHSESKTKKLIESAFGGVLFIDEAYSLGNGKDTDNFSKAAVDILNQYLSENRKDFICIIAGYERELKENFFSLNPGLERRFPWKFETSSYKENELEEIFSIKLRSCGWFCEKDIMKGIFSNKDDYPMAGGSIENLLTCCKFVHSRRIFCNDSVKKVLSRSDMEKGLKRYKENFKDKTEFKFSMMYI